MGTTGHRLHATGTGELEDTAPLGALQCDRDDLEDPMDDTRTNEHDEHDATETDRREPGARGGDESPNADRLPAAPADDGTPLGDTDQHSTVTSDRND